MNSLSWFFEILLFIAYLKRFFCFHLCNLAFKDNIVMLSLPAVKACENQTLTGMLMEVQIIILFKICSCYGMLHDKYLLL